MIGNPILFTILMVSVGLLLVAIVLNIVKRPKSRSDLPKAGKGSKK